MHPDFLCIYIFGIYNTYIRPTEKVGQDRVSTQVWQGQMGLPQADTQPDTRVDTQQGVPFKVGLIFIVSLHKFLGEKYVKIHKID